MNHSISRNADPHANGCVRCLLQRSLRHLIPLSLVVTGLSGAAAYADEADVVGGSITSLGDGRYRVDATVQHADTGWDHYANRWDVLGPDGAVLGVRELAHPHENEQPFTRSLTLEIPAGVTTITLQANDSVHGLGGKQFQLDVPTP